MVNDSVPYKLVAVPLDDLTGRERIFKDAGVSQERERVKAVIDFYSARLDKGSWSRRELIDRIFADVELGVNYLFDNPSIPDPTLSSAQE